MARKIVVLLSVLLLRSVHRRVSVALIRVNIQLIGHDVVRAIVPAIAHALFIRFINSQNLRIDKINKKLTASVFSMH